MYVRKYLLIKFSYLCIYMDRENVTKCSPTGALKCKWKSWQTDRPTNQQKIFVYISLKIWTCSPHTHSAIKSKSNSTFGHSLLGKVCITSISILTHRPPFWWGIFTSKAVVRQLIRGMGKGGSGKWCKKGATHCKKKGPMNCGITKVRLEGTV